MNEADFIPYTATSTPGSGAVLVLAPHPDDEVFGCAGAIMRHAEAGDPVHVVIVTDAAWMEGTAYAATRQHESRAAASVLGYGEPTFWGLPDRGLEYGEWLIRRVSECIEQHRAEFVYAPSCREIHPDHRALALAAAEAVRRSPRPIDLVMYEVGVPLQPNWLLDISALLIERKKAAMACFASQIERQAYDRQISALNQFRTYTLPGSVEAAEAYRIVSRDQLRANPVAALRQETFDAPGWSAEASVGLPLVSVIICRSDRPGLTEALDAVALQTYPQIEIVVVDAGGGSHSELPEWWGRFPLHRVPWDQPLPYARAANEGLDQARGDYLALFDEDTLAYPDHIATLVEILRHSRQARCACAGNGPGNEFFYQQKLLERGCVPLQTVLFDRSLLAQGCRFDERLQGAEDWDFLLQVSQHSLFICSDRVTVRSRRHGESNLRTRGGEAPAHDAAAALFDKWRTAWSGRQWADIVRSRDSQVDEVEQRVAAVRRELEDRVAELEAELSGIRSRFSELAAEREQQRGLLADMEAAVCRGLEDKESLSAWAAGLQRTVDSLQASTSWRLTVPLRFLYRIARGQFCNATPPGRSGLSHRE